MANPQTTTGFVRISTELFDALCKIRISGEARQMLDVIIRKTYGFNKKEDRIATSQFMQLTGMTRIAIYKARKKLQEMRLITVSKKGDSQVLIYSIQKDYDKWKLSPKRETISNIATNYLQKRNKTVTNKVTHKRYIDNIQYIRDFPYLKEETFKETFKNYLVMRSKIKKPPTDNAQELMLKKLHKYTADIAIKMLEQSIMGGWQGIYPLKDNLEPTIKDGFTEHIERK